ncbi:MAG: alpha/beta hydrolase [Bacteroidales bacterium]
MKFISLAILLLFLSCNKIDKDLPQPITGKIIRFGNFKSSYVKSRNIDVWIPENYSKDKRYAVIYMHDGQMLFDSTLTWNKQEWKVDESVTDLIKKDSIKECIIVGIWNDEENRFRDYLPQKPIETIDSVQLKSLFNIPTMFTFNADNYLQFITKELKPFIDKNFSTFPDLNNTYIMGSSMGGLISIYAICEYPNIFGGAACLSTHWTGIVNYNTVIPNAFYNYITHNLPSPSTHKIYFDYGTKTLDGLYKPYQLSVDSIMLKKGFSSSNWITIEFKGDDHSERSWARRLKTPLRFLLSKQ